MARVKKPTPLAYNGPASMRIVHIAWLFSRAGYTPRSINRELEILGLGAVTSYGKIASWGRGRAGWTRAIGPACSEYERRAILELSIEASGETERHVQIPADDLMMMGPLPGIEPARQSFLLPDGSQCQGDSILGAEAPDTRATATAAAKAGAGPQEILEELAALFSAEDLAVPSKIGFTMIPIPGTTKRLKKGDKYFHEGEEREAFANGVYMMGTFWDESYIVPDRTSRSKAIRLAAETLGISDKKQIEMLLTKTRALALSLKIENEEVDRRNRLEKEAQAALGVDGKEIKGGGILMVRPKEVSPEDFNKMYSGKTVEDLNEHKP